jgi:hypothetical protein
VTTPSVPDFLAGVGPQQSDMQSLWVNAATFYRTRVVFRATQTSTATTIPDTGAYTTIAFDTILEDPYSGWNATSHHWQAPAGYSGWYLATACVFVVTAPVQSIIAINILGSAQVEPASAISCTGQAGVTCADYAFLAGGQDALTVQGALLNSSSSVTTSLNTGYTSTFEVLWISS